ncbi:MAG TPA: extracellular solute-binding protein [Armatimonadota bacterium]
MHESLHPGGRVAVRLAALLILLLTGLGVTTVAADAATPDKGISVSTYSLWWAPSHGALPSDTVIKLMKQEPNIKVSEWAGLQIANAGRTPLMLAIAGQSAPDLYLSWFHIIRNDMQQKFTYPINEWVGEDKDGNGQVDPAEAKWAGWKKVPPLWRQVATDNGKVHGIPLSGIQYMGIIFRIDLVRQAGLDPNKPPKTWDEFLYWCEKLSDPKSDRRAIALPSYGFTWLPWLNSAGGSPVVQIRTSPTTGKKYTFPMEATTFLAPDTKEDLTKVTPQWQADLASDAAKDATAFYHRLRWQKWIKDPQTKEPINLTAEQVRAGKVALPDGREVTFKPDDVGTGVVLPFGGPATTVDWGASLRRGTVAMVQWFFNDMESYQQSVGIDPNLLGVFPIPGGPNGRPVVQAQRHYAVMSEGVSRRPKVERDAIWKVMMALTSSEANDEKIKTMVFSGRARFVNPNDLKRLGLTDYLKEVPPSIKQLYKGIDEGTTWVRTEPFMGFWYTMDGELNNSVLSLVLAQSGENFNYRQALDEVNDQANTGVMFARKSEELKKYHSQAWTIFAIVFAIVAFFVSMIVRTNLQAPSKSSGSRAGVYQSWLPWLLLFPALGLITMWGYYPLIRGMVMAFQDFHIVDKSPWVGLDNFISIFLNPDFYVYVSKTVKFVVLNMALVFTTPIILALLLSEIPRGKIFWRSVFFLPQLTSGLVVTLLWKLMYDPADSGLLNQVVHMFGLKSVDWLGNPKTAMIATIIPSVWVGMGISSLIYLAARKGIPDELYEASALDGAGIWAKLRYVTIPQLLPLIIINFVGAFIGTFQSMGNIFLLTFGGPGKETMVMGMAIWKAAFGNLQFSIATAMAWILGSALIGFAYLQINILRKVEYRRVEEN